MRTTICAGLLLFALTACGGGGDAVGDDEPSITPSASAGATAPETSPTVPDSAAAPINLQGNAATNPACQLLSVEQVETAAGLDVIGMLGLPNAAPNATNHLESCTWFLDPKVVQSSLVVQYTTYAKKPSDVIAYYPQAQRNPERNRQAEAGRTDRLQRE